MAVKLFFLAFFLVLSLAHEGRSGAGDESAGSDFAGSGEEDYGWQAAEIIGVSDRQMRRWRVRYEEFDHDGLLDRRRGQPSPKRVPLATVEQILGLYRDRYFDLNVQIPGASALLAFSPALVGDASHAFAQSHQLIGSDAFVRLVQSVGPVDINIDRSDCAKTKMQAGIIAGIVTGLADYRLGLCLASIVNEHTGTDRASV